MARYTKKASNDTGFIKAVVAVFLVVALVVASALTTGYLITGTANVTKWQLITQQPAPDNGGGPDGSEIEGVGNNMIVMPGEEYGILLTSELIAVEDYAVYGVDPQAKTAYEFTATVLDKNGTSNGVPQDMEGSASWKNASSSWASGKNAAQFVTVTKTDDNQFRVSCLQAFAEPVILTIKSTRANASATKQFDYVKRVSDVYLHPMDGFIEFDDCDIDIVSEIEYEVGTIEGEIYISSITYNLGSEFYSAVLASSYYKYFVQQCSAAGINEDIEFAQEFTDMFLPGTSLFWDNDPEQVSICFNVMYSSMFYNSESTISKISNATNDFEYFKYALKDAENRMTDKKQVQLCIDWSYEYDGSEYSYGSTFTSDYTLKAGWNPPEITDVIISGDSNYVF